MENSFELNENVPRIVVEYSTSIVRLAYTYVKNLSDAEDIAQDVFLVYMRKLPKFISLEHEKSWLMRVAVNKCKDCLNSYWKKRIVPISEDLSYMPNDDSALLQTVLELDEKYRITVYLFYFDDYSIKEIAALLKARPSTVGTWLERGRKLIKNKLGVDFYE